MGFGDFVSSGIRYHINASIEMKFRRPVIVIENALRCAVQILVLPVLEGPKKQNQSCQTER